MATHKYPASQHRGLPAAWMWGTKEKNQEQFPCLGTEQLEKWGSFPQKERTEGRT